jgi:GT2 family glycosyltransferase
MMSTVVVIATKGRPSDLGRLLRILRQQTVLPDRIVVSASELDDVDAHDRDQQGIEVIIGKAGLCAQRNRALARTTDFDIVIFFDDDFVPSKMWIEHARDLLANFEKINCVTGRILADGVKRGDLTWEQGEAIVEKEDDYPAQPLEPNIIPIRSPYGCNVAFRREAIMGLEFDERLVLYGWLEDLDFGVRVSKRGCAVRDHGLWGVHLGIRRSRIPGVNYGYSQVVNPWYLMHKRTIKPPEAVLYATRAILGNFVRMLALDKSVDRFGRLKGNIIGLAEIVSGRWRPERAAEL